MKGALVWVDIAAHGPAPPGSSKLMVFHAYTGGLLRGCICGGAN